MVNINKDIQEMYDQVMKQGGPSGVFTQGIVDEYNRLKNLAEPEELEKYGFRYEEKAFEEIENFIQRR